MALAGSGPPQSPTFHALEVSEEDSGDPGSLAVGLADGEAEGDAVGLPSSLRSDCMTK